jgi:glutamate--cysteine ligase
MYFVYRNGTYHNVAGQSFRDFLKGELPGLPGELPTIDDWENHLTTVFPEVRLKRFLEMRGADGGPWRLICALPALWVGLLYDEQAQADALKLVESMSAEEREFLRDEVPRLGLKTPYRNGTLQDLAKDVLKISREGLQRRGREEGKYLNELDIIAESGETQAEMLLKFYEGEWNKSVDPYYSPDFSY